MLRYLLAIIALMMTSAVMSEPVTLSGDEIRTVVGGAVFEVDAPMGYKLPIRFSENGRVTGEAGPLAYVLGAPSDKGRWWITSDRLCHKWNKWFEGTVNCLQISRHGSRILWRRDDGESGTATVISQRAIAKAPQPENLREKDASAPRTVAAPQAEPEHRSFSVVASATAMPLLETPKLARVKKPASASLPPKKKATPRQPAMHKATAASSHVVRQPDTKLANARPRHARPVELDQSPVNRRIDSFRVARVALDDLLNVREGPSAEHMVVAALPPDARGLRIIGPCQFDWCPISHRAIKGWVNSFYLTEDTHVGESHRNTFLPRVGSTQHRSR